MRRLLWWYALNWSGYNRARTLGTFGISVYSGLGAEGLHPLSPLTTTLNYGVISADGNVEVRIVYDHRVLDGSTVARALGDLEKVLTEDIPSSGGGRRRYHDGDPVARPPVPGGNGGSAQDAR
jgi:hypothetical protein